MRISDWSSYVCSSDLVPGVELAPALRVLGGDTGGAMVGVAAQRLDAAEREHEAARGVAPVRAHRHGAGDVEGAGDLAGRADPDAVAQADTDQGVVHQHQRLVHRQADVVDELRGRRAGAAFRSEEHTSELQSLMRISYAVFCLKKKKYKLQTKQNAQ